MPTTYYFYYYYLFFLEILTSFEDMIRIMVFNATFNNILVISWWSVLLVEETGVSGENQRPVASHWQTVSDNVVSWTPGLSAIRTPTFSGPNLIGKFVDTKDVMRSSKSTMEKQNNDEKKKDRKTNNSILHKNLKIEEHKPHRTGMYSLF